MVKIIIKIINLIHFILKIMGNKNNIIIIKIKIKILQWKIINFIKIKKIEIIV
jgi:hypothetical protein